MRKSLPQPNLLGFAGTQFTYQVKKNEISSQETWHGITFLTTNYETEFYTVEQTAQNPVFGPSVVEFLIIPSDDITYYERSIYNLLDLLGDIGGFSDALDGLATLFLVIFSTAIGDGPHIHMIEKVFKTRNKNSEKALTFEGKLK